MRNKNNIYAQQINSIKISLSSPEDILAKSSGEVTKPETIIELISLKAEVFL